MRLNYDEKLKQLLRLSIGTRKVNDRTASSLRANLDVSTPSWCILKTIAIERGLLCEEAVGNSLIYRTTAKGKKHCKEAV